METSRVSHGLLPDDVLSAILTVAKEESGKKSEDRFSFRGHDSRLQEVFYQLGREFDSPFVQEFVFSDRGPRPYSPILNESVSRLQLAGLLGRENPDYEVLFLHQAADHYFKDVLDAKLTDEERAQLRKIARRLLELLKPL